MADGSRTVKIEILGDAAKAVQALTDTEKSGNHLEESLGKNGEGIKSFVEGAALKLGELAAAGEAVAQIKESVNVALELGAATKKLDQETGMAAEDSSALLAAFERYGVNGEEASKSLGFLSKQIEGSTLSAEGLKGGLKGASDHLKTMGIEVLDANGKQREMKDILSDVADKFKEMQDGPEKTALAMQLFGKAGKDMIPVLNMGGEGMKDLEDESRKLGLTLSGDNVNQIEKFRLAQVSMGEAIAGVKLQLGVALMPLLTQLATLVIQGAEAFNKQAVPAIRAFISTISKDAQPVLALIGDFFTKGIVPALEWLGGHKDILTALGIAIGVIAGAWGLLTVATKAWNIVGGIAEAIMAAIESPVVLVVAAIALLAAGVYLLIKHWDEITAKVPILGEAWNGIKDFVTNKLLPALKEFAAFLLKTWNEVYPLIEAAIGKVKDVVTTVLGAIAAFISDHATQIKTILSTVWNVISTVIETVTAVIRDEIKIVLDVIHGNWSGVWNDIKDIFKSVWDLIHTILGTALELMKNVLSLAWDAIKAAASDAWNALMQIIYDLLIKIRDGITQKITDAKNAVYNIWDALKQDASNVWNDILQFIINVALNIRDKITQAPTDAKNALFGIWQALKQDAQNAWNDLKQFFENAAGNLLSVLLQPFKDFKNQVGGFLTGIPGIGGIVSHLAPVTGGTHQASSYVPSSVGSYGPASGGIQITQHITGVTADEVQRQTVKAFRHAAVMGSV